MIPLLQKGKLRKNRKTQASDFKKTWELWVPYSPECRSYGVSMGCPEAEEFPRSGDF